MKKTFLINLLLLLMINIIIKPVWLLGIDRGVQNLVGPESYGLYYALFNLTFIFSIFADVGLTNYNNRNIAQHHFLLKKYLPDVLALKIILSGLFAIIVIIAGLIMGYSGLSFQLLLWLALNQAINSFILFFRSNISGLQKFKTDSLLSSLDKLLMIIILAPVLYGGLEVDLTIKTFVLLQTVSLSLTATIAFAVVIFYSGTISFKPSLTRMKSILKSAYPFALLIVLMMIYTRLDTVMLERMLPDGAIESGYYAMGYRLLDASSMIAYLFATLLLPMFATMLKKKKSPAPLAGISFSLLFGGSVVLASLCFFQREQIFTLLYPGTTEYANNLFGLLMMVFVFTSTNYVFGTLLTANGSLKKLNRVAIIGVFINVILNFILIPEYKAEGAVWATIFTQGFTAMAQLIICKKEFNFTPKILKVLAFIGFLTLTPIGMWMIKTAGHFNHIQELLLQITLGLALVFGLKIIPLGKGISFLRSMGGQKRF
ncbi:MAG: O-antigen/teichoic acid export membrane protein [Sphingobacteriales bacterium]|jgi:O-antigen/teichoic acid export membrane protein